MPRLLLIYIYIYKLTFGSNDVHDSSRFAFSKLPNTAVVFFNSRAMGLADAFTLRESNGCKIHRIDIPLLWVLGKAQTLVCQRWKRIGGLKVINGTVTTDRVARVRQEPPPQSTPVSFWFWIPSVQVGRQASQGPPQSTPASPRFWVASVQLAATMAHVEVTEVTTT
jgi:hypothetical protein